MKKKFSNIGLSLFIFFFPLISFASPGVNVVINSSAQSNNLCAGEINNLSALFTLAICILKKAVWPLLISLAVVVFIIGVIKYISGADDATKREEGRNFMIYGIVGLFVMVSVWGLVSVLQGTFGLGNTPFIPQLEE